MLDRSTIVYYYDGTLNGLFCCIFESYAAHELPLDIIDENGGQLQLFAGKKIQTDAKKSIRVKKGLQQKAGNKALAILQRGFLTDIPQKELALLKFARLAFQKGSSVMQMLSHPLVLPIANGLTHLRREVELLNGFIRFEEYNGVLVSTITPKNQVLPLLARHFCDRYNAEAFLIYDKTHQQVLLHYGQRSEIRYMEQLQLPEAAAEEKCLQMLWQQFYNTIAIKERYNPRCQRNHLPLRYRGNMTEFQLSDMEVYKKDGSLQKQALQQRRYIKGGAQQCIN